MPLITTQSKLLTSKKIVRAIKARQAEDVRDLLQAGLSPHLAIVLTIDDPTIDVYMRMKQAYGAKLGIAVDVHRVKQDTVPTLLARLNKDANITGIIIQLPLERPEETERLTELVAPEKDVDALGSRAAFEPATPLAILWLIAGHEIDLHDKKVVLVGRGKLVGAPLERMLTKDGVDVTTITRSTQDVKAVTLRADVLITATGSAGIIRADMLKSGAVVIDAGVASEHGKTVGDVAPEVYERDDLSITPPKGGVGPLTVCALFENVIRATAATKP
jgi:methylenetetrahydrofolate dehydrogenase (NADP+)/methenyltetrahydrofolate cyclohydrolase